LSKVVAIMSMSLDGFVADPNDGVAEVFDWYFNSGDVEFHTGGADPMTFKVSGPSAEHLRGLWSELGAGMLASSTKSTSTSRRCFSEPQRAYRAVAPDTVPGEPPPVKSTGRRRPSPAAPVSACTSSQAGVSGLLPRDSKVRMPFGGRAALTVPHMRGLLAESSTRDQWHSEGDTPA